MILTVLAVDPGKDAVDPPIQRIVEGKHADGYGRANTTSASFDLEAVTMLLDLLNLHDYVSCAGWWERDVGPVGAVWCIFSFDGAVKFLS